MSTDDELTDSERSKLDAWAPISPPRDFADRVLAARGEPAVAPRRRRWPLVATAVLGAAAATAIALVALRDPSRAASGELVAAPSRITKNLGDRAVAVAEPQATLAWRIDDDGNAVIDQRAGDVFYRVDRGGSFVVHTPVGDVRVTGTCFRVEVTPMNRTKQLLLSGTIGAAVATGVVVTVYEGHVIADSKAGNRTEIVAGNRATLSPDGHTLVAATNSTSVEATPPLDATTASRDQLVARAHAQQSEITKLRARVAQLEHGRAGYDNEGTEEGRTWFDPSPERLKAWAAECRVRADEPGFDRWEPLKSLGKNERGLEQSELAHVNAALAEIHAQWKALVRALYLEATGDTAGADTLSLEAMRREVEEKGAGGEGDSLLQRIAAERAGLAQPPADLANATPFERMFRAYIDLGNQAEAALAKRLGADRAKQIRGDGWGSRHDWAGCPDSQ